MSFQLKNSLGSGYAKGMTPVVLDGVECSMDGTFFVMEGNETAFSEVADDNRFTIALNKAITIIVKGASPGPRPSQDSHGFRCSGPRSTSL